MGTAAGLVTRDEGEHLYRLAVGVPIHLRGSRSCWGLVTCLNTRYAFRAFLRL